MSGEIVLRAEECETSCNVTGWTELLCGLMKWVLALVILGVVVSFFSNITDMLQALVYVLFGGAYGVMVWRVIIVEKAQQELSDETRTLSSLNAQAVSLDILHKQMNLMRRTWHISIGLMIFSVCSALAAWFNIAISYIPFDAMGFTLIAAVASAISFSGWLVNGLNPLSMLSRPPENDEYGGQRHVTVNIYPLGESQQHKGFVRGYLAQGASAPHPIENNPLNQVNTGRWGWFTRVETAQYSAQ